MGDVIQEVLWTEKHRPTKLADVALDPENAAALEGYIASGEIPHLLLVGPPGSGKTTVAKILINALDCQHITLNASADRGIDIVRNRIGKFVISMFPVRWNIVFLDEADEMTSDAQTALRNMIETYADRSRFILTANRGHRVIGAIQSRCQLLTLGRPPLKERFRVLTAVLHAEGIPATPEIVFQYAEKFPDMRRMLWATQRAWMSRQTEHTDDCALGIGGDACDCPAGALTSPRGADHANGADIFAHVKNKNWAALRRLSASGEFDHAESLRDLFWAIPDNHPNAGFLRHVIGRGVHETGFTPDPVVLFLAVCAEAMEGIDGG